VESSLVWKKTEVDHYKVSLLTTAYILTLVLKVEAKAKLKYIVSDIIYFTGDLLHNETQNPNMEPLNHSGCPDYRAGCSIVFQPRHIKSSLMCAEL
jgi:hypothetical protein